VDRRGLGRQEAGVKRDMGLMGRRDPVEGETVCLRRSSDSRARRWRAALGLVSSRRAVACGSNGFWIRYPARLLELPRNCSIAGRCNTIISNLQCAGLLWVQGTLCPEVKRPGRYDNSS